jgi:hypothetical protein
MNVESRSGTNMRTDMKSGQKDQSSMRTENVASCFLEESTYLRAPIGKIWECIKEFNFEKICPTKIRSCKFLTGNPMQIGSTYKLEFNDGTTFTFMIVEMSELKRKYTFEMIDCEPKQNFSSMLSTLKCCPVTNDNTTVLTWQTLYSNDVTPDIIRNRKEVIKSYFSDMKKCENIEKISK